MKRKTTIICLFFLFGLINLKTQCNRNAPQPPDYKYTFTEEIAVTPYQLNYNVGDTIWLQLNVPGKKLYDAKTNARIFFDSASIVMAVSVNLLFNNPYVGDGPFATYIFPTGVSGYTTNYTSTTQAYITSGCTSANSYLLNIGVVLLQKGVFSLGVYGNDLQNCFNGYSANASLGLLLHIDDTHKAFYQQLPFTDIGKRQDMDVLLQLDAKRIAVINVL